MNNDLIKRADVKESLLGWETDPTDEEIEYTIDGIPAVDAVEVVRCKDCQYFNRDSMSPGTGWCEHLERGEYEQHFCNYADRRMDGE